MQRDAEKFTECIGMHRVQRVRRVCGEWEQPTIFQYGNEGSGVHRVQRCA